MGEISNVGSFVVNVINLIIDLTRGKKRNVVILNKREKIYVNSTLNKVTFKVMNANGTTAVGIPIEFCIKDNYGPTVERTNNEGIVSFKNVSFKKCGEYEVYVKEKNNILFWEKWNIEEGKVYLRFVQHPENIKSHQHLGHISVEAFYDTGDKVQNINVRLELNVEGVDLKGIKVKQTNHEGIACFDELTMTKTGVYKLSAACNGTIIYSEPFHVYPPGLVTDFESCEAGSQEEIECVLTSLIENLEPGDVIKYNGEEY